MHEYSIIQSLVEAVQSEVDAHGASGVHRVVIRIGELSGVDAELLATAYYTFKEKTVCENAELEMRHVAAIWVCGQCARAIGRGEILHCPECRIPATLQAGDEIILEKVEMEVP